MLTNQYQFLTRWRVEATPAEVYRILEDTPGLVRWWPAVWLTVEEVHPGNEERIGSVYQLTSKGWLPYILTWSATTTAKEFPTRIALEARGDFHGRGVWTIHPNGSWTDVEYLWEIAADKPLLRYLSFALKPVFRANHEWAMRVGEVSLRRELRRRRATSIAEQVAVPLPPGPTFLSARRRRRLKLNPV